MNREIEFRGKTINGNEWIYGPTISRGTIKRKSNTWFMEVAENKWKGLRPNTLGQYTGLKDKNGKKIYEGDVLEIAALDFLDKATNKKNFIVRYENGFICHIVNEPHCWMHLKTAYEKSSYRLKKIGNIYDNPELVEE